MRLGISKIFILGFVFLYGCSQKMKSSKEVRLQFLDEYILPNDMFIDSTLVGGLSGIDFYNNTYYIACDDDQNPRFYTANITISNAKFDTIAFSQVVRLDGVEGTLDLESIIVDSTRNEVLLVSEGNIKKGADPSFFSVTQEGTFKEKFKIPQYFKAKGKQLPRHNGVFEGLTQDFEEKGYWIPTELPLKLDGSKPKFTETTSPVRFTYFNKQGDATKQFAYLLDNIAKKPLGDFAVNGITDVLAYAPNKLLTIERSYSSGYGNQGNVIKIYSVDYTDAVNTLKYKKLTKVNYYPIEKELVFNFETIKDVLQNKGIDNIEGVCFGPELPNGNKTLLFISDNDFNKQGNRQNQFILMEMIY